MKGSPSHQQTRASSGSNGLHSVHIQAGGPAGRRQLPTVTQEPHVQKTVERDGNHTDEMRKMLTPRQYSSPQIYGLPKIHKEGLPPHPIVYTIPYVLAKELTWILSPLIGGTSSFVKNSTHFVERISSLKMDSNDHLVSFNVKSLYSGTSGRSTYHHQR